MQDNHFFKAFGAALVLILSFIVFWEYYWRQKGFPLSYNDDKVIWANIRGKIYLPPEKSTVFIGDSRAKFDIHLETWKALTGEEPVQLAMVGTSPRPVLINLANDEHFRGKVIIGVSEAALYSLDTTSRERSARDGIEYYKNETPAQNLNASIDFMLESKLVFLEEGKFGLNSLLSELDISNRPGIVSRNLPPKKFSFFSRDRQAAMTDMFFQDSMLRQQVINYWTQGALRNKSEPIQGDTLEHFFQQLKNAMDKIRSRGGKIMMIRPPSTGSVLARETKSYPRDQYWDRLLKFTGIDGIYYTDYPEMASLTCPEESHLSPSDAARYTNSLIKILQEKKWFSSETSNYINRQLTR
jgi:hypothetical protein